jgi:hypothetical protein
MRFPTILLTAGLSLIGLDAFAQKSVRGNSACWGDDTRQDISCRALTEKFLMSLRGATKAEITKAMGVSGLPRKDGRLHFVSNYAKAERGRTGDVDFSFDHGGKVNIIFAIFDSDSDGLPPEFQWNAELLPGGCSDLPSTTMKHCN